MSLKAFAAAGAAAGLLQLLFLAHFGAPLAEKLHDILAAGQEEVYAYWVQLLVAALAGALWGVVLSALAKRLGLATGALAAFVGFSLLPILKWLPTPHGVSYVEPVEWREAVHGLYLLYNGVVLWALALRKDATTALASAAALAVGFYAFPNFTLPSEYWPYVPELEALQGIALSSWALFWAVTAALAYALLPIKRPWR